MKTYDSDMNNSENISGKTLIKNSFFNLMGMLIPILIGVLAIPFAIRGLGKEGFGVLSIVWVIIGYLTLLDFGISRASTNFISKAYGEVEDSTLSTILIFSPIMALGIGIIGGTALFLFSPFLIQSILKVPDTLQIETVKAFHYLSFGFPVFLISLNFKGMLGAAQRFDLVNVVQIPVNTIGFIIPALSAFMLLRLDQIVFYIIVLRLIACIIWGCFCWKQYANVLIKSPTNLSIIKKLLSYGGWVSVTSFVSPLLVYLDRFFIGSILSMETLAFYSAPVEAITRLRIFPTAIMTTLFPEISKGISGQDKDRLTQILKMAFKLILIFSGMVSIVLFFFAKDILQIWLGSDFVGPSLWVFKIISLCVFINFLAFIPFTFLQGIGRPDIPAKFHLAEFIGYVFIVWFFISKWGLIGAALAWGLRVLVDALLLFLKSENIFPGFASKLLIQNNQKNISILLVFVLAVFFISFIIPTVVLRILILFLFSSCVLFWIWRWGFSKRERSILLSMIKLPTKTG